jgi:hypothetical protein
MAQKIGEAANFVFMRLNEQEPGFYITNTTQTVLGGTKEIWLGKGFLTRRRSLDPG